MNNRDTLRYDIGGVFELVLVNRRGEYYGHYKNKKTGLICSYDGSGLTKKQIIKIFWEKVKEIQSA